MSAFFVGLLGGAHCIGMCGPLVSIYNRKIDSGTQTDQWWVIRQNLLFNIGRVCGYTIAGFLLGLLGTLVWSVTRTVPGIKMFRGIWGIIIGGLIVFVGLSYTVRGHAPSLVGFFESGLQTSGFNLQKKLTQWVNNFGIIGLGATHALLPCPILYPVYLYALVEADPYTAAGYMAVMGLGTIPSLLFVSFLTQTVGSGFRLNIQRIMGAFLVLLGFIPLTMGVSELGYDVPMIMLPYVSPNL